MRSPIAQPSPLQGHGTQNVEHVPVNALRRARNVMQQVFHFGTDKPADYQKTSSKQLSPAQLQQVFVMYSDINLIYSSYFKQFKIKT